MRKYFILFVMSFVPFIINSKNYYDIEKDGIFYKLNYDKGEAKVVMGCTEYATDLAYGEYPVKKPSYSGDVIIPESFEYDGKTFVVTSIAGNDLPKMGNLTSYGAFEGCDKLTSITIPKSIKRIDTDAFSGCTSLSAVYISDLAAWCNIDFHLTDWNGFYGVGSGNPLYIAHNLYLNNQLITDLYIPDDITTIQKLSFIGGNFKSVIFHKNFERLSEMAFLGCSELKNIYCYSPHIYFPGIISVFPYNEDISLHIRERYKDNYTVSNDDYNGWRNFVKIEYIDGVDYNLVYVVDDAEYKKNIMEVGEEIAPESDPSKEGYTFSGWSEIPEKMPAKDVTVTGSFSPNTYKLTYNVDGEEYKVVEVKCDEAITPEPVPTKQGMTFSGWSEIPEKMPAKDVTVTGTFSWSKVINNGVIYQVYNAEDELADVCGNDNASGDVKIVSPVEIDGINYSVTDIVDFSFKGNTDITSVVIPESVMKIGDEAFYGCKNLVTIELGKSVNQIEPRAFAGIDKLTDVTCYVEDLVPDADRTAFENSYIEDYVTLHVPAGSIEKYKAVAPWKNFKEIVAIDGTEEAKDEDPAKDEENDDATEDVITLKDSGKGTWCSENDLDFTGLEDIKAYIASGYDDIKKTIWLTRVYSVPAGTGIMVKGTPGEHKIPYAKVRAYYANMFKGVVGTAVKIESTDGDWTNYYMAGGQFKIVNGSTTINPNRCYLQLPTLVFAGTRSVDVVYEDEIDDKTGINPSFITNDQEPGAIYNLQGQRVENPRKGVYIMNGKKVVIRSTTK